MKSADGVVIEVPDVEQEVCTSCQEVFIGEASGRHIDDYIAEITERIPASELLRLRERYNVDQATMGQIIGLGEKTYHRWERGTQFPSRSMGYYLRVLREFPEVFEWLRERGWQRNNIIQVDRAVFQYLGDLEKSYVVMERPKNPAKVLVGGSK